MRAVLRHHLQAAIIRPFSHGFKVLGGLVATQDSDSGSRSSMPNSRSESDPPTARESSHPWRSKFTKLKESSWFAGIVTGLITGALVTFSITVTGHSTGIRIFQMVHLAGSPSCTDPGWLLQVPDDQILANSWYAATDNVQDYKTLHTPDLTVDGNPRSAWLQWWPSSGIDDSPGSGNYITWSFAQSYDIRLVCILNGWEEDSHTFNSAEPVKSATIGDKAPGCSGTQIKFTTHSYTYAWNEVKLSRSHPTGLLCLQITAPYHETYKTDEQLKCAPVPQGSEGSSCRLLTGISEIRFYYSPSMLNRVPY